MYEKTVCLLDICFGIHICGDSNRLWKWFFCDCFAICLRWELQNGIIPLPKTMSEKRMKENLDIFDFEISKEDMEVLNTMEKCGASGLHPDKQ